MIEIWEPRYKDKTLLVKLGRLSSSEDNRIKITKGYYKGEYVLPAKDVEGLPTEHKDFGEMVIVPLSKLAKIEPLEQ